MSLSETKQNRLLISISNTLNIPHGAINLQSKRASIPQWDSLKHFEVMMEIEKEFDIRFTSEELTSNTEIKTISELISRYQRD